jgi:hypothetical protein
MFADNPPVDTRISFLLIVFSISALLTTGKSYGYEKQELSGMELPTTKMGR